MLLDEIRKTLGQAINDKPNADYHIRGAREQLADVQNYLESLEATVLTLSKELHNSRTEAKELRRKLP